MNDLLNKEEVQENEVENKKSLKKWFKKIGVAGIIFFTVKGIISTYFIVQLGKCALQ